MEEYRIEKLAVDRFELLIPLMKDCFGINVNIDYFKWKFIDNPSGQFVGFVAFHQKSNELAGYYGVIPEEYSIFNKRKIIFQSCDTMTSSKHRRKGLFQKLASHCYQFLEENHELNVIGFGGEQSTPGFIKLGWKHLFDVKYLFVPKLFCFTSVFSNFKDVRIVKAEEVYHLNQQKGDANIHSFRTLEQFKWRLNNPLHPCITVKYKDDSYLSYYFSDGKIFLFDFYFSTTFSGRKLVNYLKKEVLKNKAKGIITLAQYNSPFFIQLHKRGFFHNPFSKGPLNTKIPFIFLTQENGIIDFSNSSNWNVSPYDHDSL